MGVSIRPKRFVLITLTLLIQKIPTIAPGSEDADTSPAKVPLMQNDIMLLLRPQPE